MRLSLLDLLPAPGAAQPACHVADAPPAPLAGVAPLGADRTPCARSWLLFLSHVDPMVCLSAYLVVHMEYGRGALVPALGRSWRGESFDRDVMSPLLSLLLERVQADSGIPARRFLNPYPTNPASHGYIVSTVAWSGESRDFLPGPFPADLLVSAGALHRIYLQHRDYHAHMQPQSLNF